MVELSPRGDAYVLGFAGDTFNTAWYARRIASLETEVVFMSAVGDDEISGRMTAFIAAAGITPELQVRPGRTVGLYLIQLDGGERSFFYWRETSAARSLADDLPDLSGLVPGDIVYFSGITLAILPSEGRATLLDAVSAARRAGATVAFDPNLRPRLWDTVSEMRDWIMRAAATSDVILPSHDDEGAHFGDPDCAATAWRYAGCGADLVVVKDAANPITILPNGEEMVRVATTPVDQVVDTTAAGDSFNAAFMLQLQAGHSPTDSSEAAARLARHVVATPGALAQGLQWP